MGNTEVTFARCVATGAKPPAEVSWDTGSLGESVKAETTSFSDDITTTTVSSLTGVPTKGVHGHKVRCLVKHLALTKEESLPLTLEVHCESTLIVLHGSYTLSSQFFFLFYSRVALSVEEFLKSDPLFDKTCGMP